MRVMITLMALRALIIRLLHLTFLKLCAATCWLTNTLAVQRSCGSTVATLNTSRTKLRVILNVHHTTQNSFRAPKALGERGKNANRIVA